MRSSRLLFFLLFSVFSLSGCTERGARPDANIVGNIFKDALRGILAGQSYDSALLAQGRDDDAAYVKATTRLQQSGAPDAAAWAKALTLRRAEEAVYRGISLDSLARSQTAASKEKWEKRALESYRRALVFAPDFPSENPDLLNGLGY